MDAGLDALTVLITGASGGIGLALAHAFAAEGARLLLHSHLPYSVTKAGLHGLMRSLKNELPALDPYARVNTVEPGWTVTPMAEAALDQPGAIAKVCATMPVRQLARPEDIARAVVFMSSPTLARHVSGEVLTVAGGMEGRKLWTADEIDDAAVRARLESD